MSAGLSHRLFLSFRSIPLVRLSLSRLLLTTLAHPSLHPASHARPGAQGTAHLISSKWGTGPFRSISLSILPCPHTTAPPLCVKCVLPSPRWLHPSNNSLRAGGDTHEKTQSATHGAHPVCLRHALSRNYRLPAAYASLLRLRLRLHAVAPVAALAKCAWSETRASFFLYCESSTTSADASLLNSVV